MNGIDDDAVWLQGAPAISVNLEIAEKRFSENGFNWHLIRFRDPGRPNGPLWVVPHDDENAAFIAMMTALKIHGGVGIAVNSGAGSSRMQRGHGRCGGRSAPVTRCDPNRNFDSRAPLYSSVILDQRPVGQPIIALHTNMPGFHGDGRGGAGHLSLLDRDEFRRGVTKARPYASIPIKPATGFANFDSFGLIPFAGDRITPAATAIRCAQHFLSAGIGFWLERVIKSDGSLSNHITLDHPGIRYFTAESRSEFDPAVAAARLNRMAAVYLESCNAAGSDVT